MKAIFREETTKTTSRQAYELNPVEELSTLSNGKIIRAKKNKVTGQVEQVTAIGIVDDMFCIQVVSTAFGEAQSFKEGFIETLVDIKLYAEIAEYVGDYLASEIMDMELITDIGAFKGDYEYNGEKVTVYYSGNNKDMIWLSGKAFKGNEFKQIEEQDLSSYFKFQ